MSRQEKVKATEQKAAATHTAQPQQKAAAEKVMTAEQFFRKNARPAWLVVLAKSAFNGKVMTEGEWHRNVDELSKKKITG